MEDDDLERDDTQPQRESEDIRLLRKKAKRADELEPEVSKLRQQLAIAQAGLSDLNDKQVKALIASHDGEWDGESLKATAVDLGFAKAPEPEVPAEELKTLERMANASAGAEHVGKVRPVDEIASAQTPEEVMAAYRKAGGNIAQRESSPPPEQAQIPATG